MVVGCICFMVGRSASGSMCYVVIIKGRKSSGSRCSIRRTSFVSLGCLDTITTVS